MMRQWIRMFVCVLLLSAHAHASMESNIPLLPIDVNWHDQAALQRGAKLYMNYCSGCHSLHYMRYNRMARDLGLTTFDGDIDTDLLQNNLIFTSARVQDPIDISMPAVDARQWFGVEPPDLTLIARKRGASWLYTYLHSFYDDPSRPFGANNWLYPDVAMPNVLEPLSGQRVAVREGEGRQAHISHLVRVGDGRMTEQEFDRSLIDLVTFLSYVGEPMKLERQRIGGFVLVFLALFLLILYLLKRSYWQTLRHGHK